MSLIERLPKKWRKPFIATGLTAWIAFVTMASNSMFSSQVNILNPLETMAFFLKFVAIVCLYVWTIWLVSEALRDWNKS